MWITRHHRDLIVLTFLFALVPVVQAQDVLRPGSLDLEEVSVSDEIDGFPIVPELRSDEGVLRLVVERNNYFNIEDVARWLRNNDMQLVRLGADVSNARVRDDNAIWVRFRQEFIGDARTIARPVQIRHPNGHFDNFFRPVQFYRQQVVTYRLRVQTEPVFSEHFVPTGYLTVISNREAANISIFNERGERVADRLAIQPDAESGGYRVDFDDIPIGSYTLQATSTGMRPVNLSGIVIAQNERVSRDIEFMADQVQAEGQAMMIVTTNVPEVELDMLFEDGTRQQRVIFDGIMRAALEPGRYRLRMHPEGYQEYEQTINLESGQTIEENITFTRMEPIRALHINSDPYGARVILNDEDVGTTPLVLRDIPRESMELTMTRDYYRTHRDTFILHTEDEYTYFQELSEGYMEITSEPWATVNIDGSSYGRTPVLFNDPEPRVYEIQLTRQDYATIDTVVDMSSRDIFRLDAELTQPRSRITIRPEYSYVPVSVALNGDNVSLSRSDITAMNLDLLYGTYELEFRRTGFHTKQKTVRIQEEQQIIYYDMEPKSKTGSFFRSMFLPGSGQYYYGNGLRGTVFLFGFLGMAGYTGYEFIRYLDLEDSYTDARSQYQSATTREEIVAHRRDMERYYVQMLDKRDDLDLYLQITAGIYALNLLDRLFVRSASRTYRRQIGSEYGAQFSVETVPGAFRVSLGF